MATMKSTDSRAISYKLSQAALEISIIRDLVVEIIDQDTNETVNALAAGIDALASRAGRVVDRCAGDLGASAVQDWEDYPLPEAIQKEEVAHG